MPAASRFSLLLVAGCLAGAATFASAGDQASFGMLDQALARSDYIENCGGCHGVTGSTAPATVPELRGRVGFFLCTPETRAYLLRLPNVAHSRIADNQQLAEVMNYVVFVLGGASAPRGRPPFTGAEVARERLRALSSANLTQERARNVRIVMRQCNAPASLRSMYDRAQNQ